MCLKIVGGNCVCVGGGGWRKLFCHPSWGGGRKKYLVRLDGWGS